MTPINENIEVKKISDGVIAMDESNVFEVVESYVPETHPPECFPGDKVIVEEHNIIKVEVESEESLFVNKIHVLAVISKPEEPTGGSSECPEDNCDCSPT